MSTSAQRGKEITVPKNIVLTEDIFSKVPNISTDASHLTSKPVMMGHAINNPNALSFFPIFIYYQQMVFPLHSYWGDSNHYRPSELSQITFEASYRYTGSDIDSVPLLTC